MSKIIGNTVGTPLNPKKITEEAKAIAIEAKTTAEEAEAKAVNFKAVIGAYITDDSITVGDYVATEGLQFNELADGTYQVSVGTATNVTEIIIPSTHNGVPVTQIPDSGFRNLQKLTKVIIGDNVKFISHSAFKECTNLKEITVGKGVDEIGVNAFDKCANLINVNYNAVNCTSIGNNRSPFTVCGRDSGGFNVTVGEGVESIPAYLFRHYDDPPEDDEVDVNDGDVIAHLKSIVIPLNVKTIGENAFLGCTELTDIYFKGTESAWNEIEKENSKIPNGTVVHFANERIEEIEKTLFGEKTVEILPENIRSGGTFKFVGVFDSSTSISKGISIFAQGDIGRPLKEIYGVGAGEQEIEFTLFDYECRNGIVISPAGLAEGTSYILYRVFDGKFNEIDYRLAIVEQALGSYINDAYAILSETTALLGGDSE